MTKVTLGGDRLGQGQKQKVELPNYGRSTHNQSYVLRTSMAAGTLVPFMKEVGLPGTTFDIGLRCDVKTHPTVGPLFGSFKVALDVFMVPIRLYNAAMHNNQLGIGLNVKDLHLPQIEVEANQITHEEFINLKNPNRSQINPSSILAYLDIMGIGIPTNLQGVEPKRQFNAVPYLAYWDIYKNYYANKQEKIGAVIHSPAAPLVLNVETINMAGVALNENITGNPAALTLNSITIISLNTPIVDISTLDGIIISLDNGLELPITELFVMVASDGSGASFRGSYKWAAYGDRIANFWRSQQPEDLISGVQVATFPLSNIDAMRKELLKADDGSPFIVNDYDQAPYNLIHHKAGEGFRSILQNQEGLALKCYMSDLFNNWLDTEFITGSNGINELTRVDTNAGYFNIDSILLAEKVYKMLNAIAVSGGSWDDYLNAVYNQEKLGKLTTPAFIGGYITELEFQEVISNVQGQPNDENGAQPLGTLAGKGVVGRKNKGGKIIAKCTEPCYIMGIASITPRLDYSQGNMWDTDLKTMDDFHKPALDRIGFQDLYTGQMAWWDSYQLPNGTWVKRSAGKQTAWLNYQTNVNKIRGNFAGDENFMVLDRNYEIGYDNNTKVQIQDLTTYIDPAKFNYIFAQTSRDAQNFWMQIGVNIEARRLMSAKVQPSL